MCSRKHELAMVPRSASCSYRARGSEEGEEDGGVCLFCLAAVTGRGGGRRGGDEEEG